MGREKTIKYLWREPKPTYVSLEAQLNAAVADFEAMAI